MKDDKSTETEHLEHFKYLTGLLLWTDGRTHTVRNWWRVMVAPEQ